MISQFLLVLCLLKLLWWGIWSACRNNLSDYFLFMSKDLYQLTVYIKISW